MNTSRHTSKHMLLDMNEAFSAHQEQAYGKAEAYRIAKTEPEQWESEKTQFSHIWEAINNCQEGGE